MQTVIRGQQSGQLIFWDESMLDVRNVVYASFDEWVKAGKDFGNLPLSAVKLTDIDYKGDDPAEFRRAVVKWLLRKAKSDHPPVAVLATGANRDG